MTAGVWGIGALLAAPCCIELRIGRSEQRPYERKARADEAAGPRIRCVFSGATTRWPGDNVHLSC